MYKLAVFDMDGTLLNNNHEISKENLKALDYLKEKGIKTVIATGRPSELLKKYTNELKMDEYVITCNGSVIGRPFSNDIIHENVIDKENVISIIDMCEEYNYDYLVYTKEAVISKDNARLRLFKKVGSNYKESDKANIIETEDSNYIKNNFKPNKILILESNPIKYKELWGKMSEFKNIEYTQSWLGALDVSPMGDTKGKAVEKLCKHYNILKEEVIAFGDQLNDLSMIEYAGMGVAMGNAEEEVKQVADYVTLSNNENGVAEAIKIIIL